MKKAWILFGGVLVGAFIVGRLAFNPLIQGLVFARSLTPPTPPILADASPGFWSGGSETHDCARVDKDVNGTTNLRERLGATIKIGADGRKLAINLERQGFIPFSPCAEIGSIHAMKFYQAAGNPLQPSPIEAVVMWREGGRNDVIASWGSVAYRYEGP